MLPHSASPVYRLIIEVLDFEANPTGRTKLILSLMGWRNLLWQAVHDEVDSHLHTGIDYEPLSDNRVKWLIEWIDIRFGLRRKFSSGTEASMLWACGMTEPVLSGKDFAADPELSTLAQGS